jgi:hypothetical protein
MLFCSDPELSTGNSGGAEPDDSKGSLTDLLNSRADAFLAGESGGLLNELVKDVQQVRQVRSERSTTDPVTTDPTTAESPANSVDPDRLFDMIVQGRYKAATNVRRSACHTRGGN